MKKGAFKKILNRPIRPLKLDATEFLLLAFVTLGLLIFFGLQTGLLPNSIANSLILGASIGR